MVAQTKRPYLPPSLTVVASVKGLAVAFVTIVSEIGGETRSTDSRPEPIQPEVGFRLH